MGCVKVLSGKVGMWNVMEKSRDERAVCKSKRLLLSLNFSSFTSGSWEKNCLLIRLLLKEKTSNVEKEIYHICPL